jgi:hypothetical protein
MTQPAHQTLVIDTTRTAVLDTGWRAALCVAADGTESLWVLAPNLNAPAGCACDLCAPHDQLTPWRSPSCPA